MRRFLVVALRFGDPEVANLVQDQLQRAQRLGDAEEVHAVVFPRAAHLLGDRRQQVQVDELNRHSGL